MTAEEYFKNWIEENKYEYDNFPIDEIMEAYYKERVNAISDEDVIKVPKYQLKEIEDTLRLVHNSYNMKTQETCLDRMVCKTWEWTKQLLKQ